MTKEQKKYRFTGETMEYEGHTLHRIEALVIVGPYGPLTKLHQPMQGGWIENEANLSQDSGCFVYDEAKVFGNAKVEDNAVVQHNAVVCGDAGIKELASVSGNAIVRDYALVNGKSKIFGDAIIRDYATISGESQVRDKAIVMDVAQVVDGEISDNAIVKGYATVNGFVAGKAVADLNSQIDGYITESAIITGDTHVEENAMVVDGKYYFTSDLSNKKSLKQNFLDEWRGITGERENYVIDLIDIGEEDINLYAFYSHDKNKIEVTNLTSEGQTDYYVDYSLSVEDNLDAAKELFFDQHPYLAPSTGFHM